MYTDGNSFSVWRDGELDGEIVKFNGDVASSGVALAAPPSIIALFTDFLSWTPIPPKTPKRLAEVSARLCRLLREEVVEQLKKENVSLAGLANDWRKLLFPLADDAAFADGYAQAVTFGLLIARALNIPLEKGIEQAASALRKSNTLIGTALRLLTDDADNQQALSTSLDTMTRVSGSVDWSVISKDDPDACSIFMSIS